MSNNFYSPVSKSSPMAPVISIEATRLEIALLALGILFLVVQLGALIFIGVKRRRKSEFQRQYSTTHPLNRRHDRPSKPCLWREVFPDHRRHGFMLLDSDESSEEKVTFVGKVRKKSEVIMGAMHHELMAIRRKMSSGATVDPAMMDVETGVDRGMSEYGRDRAESLGVTMRTGVEVGGRACLRRHSSLVRGTGEEKEAAIV
ncbi:hypothetical protein OQA88_296 [Cercophora sp. LCS_1]